MRHRVKKIKFRGGRDANRMLIRKLTVNFLKNAKIKTTLKKAKTLKTEIEKLVEKAKVENEANKNVLLKSLNDSKLVSQVIREVGRPLADKVGGYVRVVKLGARQSDGAEMARLEWAYPVVKSDKAKKNHGKPNSFNKTSEGERHQA